MQLCHNIVFIEVNVVGVCKGILWSTESLRYQYLGCPTNKLHRNQKINIPKRSREWVVIARGKAGAF